MNKQFPRQNSAPPVQYIHMPRGEVLCLFFHDLIVFVFLFFFFFSSICASFHYLNVLLIQTDWLFPFYFVIFLIACNFPSETMISCMWWLLCNCQCLFLNVNQLSFLVFLSYTVSISVYTLKKMQFLMSSF